MNPFEGLFYGLQVAFTPENLLAAVVGAMAGSLLGVLPGLGPVAGAAIVLPLTASMGPTAGVIMIAAIYYGAMYGGSTTSILLNIPGEPSSIVSAIEGYPMAKKGRAGPALGIVAIASLVAGVGSVLLVALFTPLLAEVGLLFRSAEYFALTMGGLLVMSRLVGDDLLSGLLPLSFGLALGTIGAEGQTGLQRFTFGHLELLDGIPLVVVAVGAFGLAELMVLAKSDGGSTPFLEKLRVRDLWPSRTELMRSRMAWVRGGIIGFLLGLLPGPSATMSTFASYKVETSLTKFPEEIGKGNIEGLAGPEAANNAAATSGVVPVLALGIPFSGTLALLLSAMVSQGVTPGPLLAVQHPDIFWGVISSMLIGNVILFILNVPFIGVWVSLLRVPIHLLVPTVAVLAFIGAYADRNLALDLYFVVAFGVAGYFLTKYQFSLAPMLVGLLLCPLAEKHLRTALFTSRGDVGYLLWSSPIVVAIWVLVAIALLWPLLSRLASVRHKRRLRKA